ncbi:MAG TPA: hypothetical protein VGA53_00530 [Candidatus Paceibacterota bacterium]
MTQATLQKLQNGKGRLLQNEKRYQEAWKKLEQVSSRLPKLWKTKKTSLQILKQERSG